MVQLICLSEQCNKKGLLSDLQDILPHIQDRHELMDINDFRRELGKIQSQVQNFGGLQEILNESLTPLRKLLDDIQHALEHESAPIQIVCQGIELEASEIQDAICLYKQFQDLQQNQRHIHNIITQDFQTVFTKFTTLISNYHDKLKNLQAFPFYKEIMIPMKQNQSDEQDNQQNDSQKTEELNKTFAQLQIDSNQFQSNVIPNIKLLDQFQQIQENSLSQPQQNLQLQKENNLVVTGNLFGQPLLEIPAQIPVQIQPSSWSINNDFQLLSGQFQGIYYNDYESEQSDTQEIIAQFRFNRYLSEKNVVFSDYNTDEAIIADRKYLICDEIFLMTECSKLDLLIIPNTARVNIKIGMVCLNRWNRDTIEKYKRTQETYSNRGNPYLAFFIYSIDSEIRFIVRVENKMLYIDSDDTMDLEEEGFSEDDECSFYIELKHCKVIVE